MAKPAGSGGTQLGQRIRAVRKASGLPMREFARRVGVTPPSVWRWEAGSSMPTIGMLVAISDGFDVGLDWLVRGTGREAA